MAFTLATFGATFGQRHLALKKNFDVQHIVDGDISFARRLSAEDGILNLHTISILRPPDRRPRQMHCLVLSLTSFFPL
jgi:hypothetical protein